MSRCPGVSHKSSQAVFTQLLQSHRLKVKLSPLLNSTVFTLSEAPNLKAKRTAFIDFTEDKEYCYLNLQKEKIKYKLIHNN